LVLWYQVLDKAASEKVPVIIVTDDVKEDWWWRHEGKIIGPNPDLVEEIRGKADVGFYMYVSDQFMEYARQYLKQTVDQHAIDEIREVRRHDEQQRREMGRFLRVQEARMDEVNAKLHELAAESGHLRAEIDEVTTQMQQVLLAPSEGRESPSAQHLVDTLSRRRMELEARSADLEERRHYLDQEFGLLAARRNSLVHHSSGLVHDGSVRTRLVPPFRVVPGAVSSAGHRPIVRQVGGSAEDPKVAETRFEKGP
jgi:hypothetical protein